MIYFATKVMYGKCGTFSIQVLELEFKFFYKKQDYREVQY